MTPEEQDAYFDHRSEWSHASGASTAFFQVLGMVEERASKAFLAKKDDLAREYRVLAYEIRGLREGEQKTVQKNIELARSEYMDVDMKAVRS